MIEQSRPPTPPTPPPLLSFSIMEKLLTSATQTSGEVMHALMAPCLVIYGEACHYFRIYDQPDTECILPQFHLAIIYLDFYGNKVSYPPSLSN